MGIMEKVAAEGLTLGLHNIMRASPVDIGTIADVLEASGKAQVILAGKIRDGKLTEEEVSELAGAFHGNIGALLVLKAAISRAIEQVF